MKKISLVILNWNGWEMTNNCLMSLGRIDTNGLILEIVVVDNGSTDNSLDEIKDQISKIRSIAKNSKIISNNENLGFAEGNNVGIKYALENGADYVCLINNDTRVAPKFLIELVKVIEKDETIGIIGGKIYFEKGYEFHKEKYSNEDLGKVIWYAGGEIDWQNVIASHRGVDEIDRGQYETEAETEYINGCLMLVKRQVFEKIGLFDKKYYLYYEENDFCQKTKKAGFKLFFEPKSIIWHLNAGSSGVGSGLQDYFISRNRMLFGMKYAPLRSKLALVLESLRILRTGREWQKRGLKDFYLGKFGKGSWKN